MANLITKMDANPRYDPETELKSAGKWRVSRQKRYLIAAIVAVKYVHILGFAISVLTFKLHFHLCYLVVASILLHIPSIHHLDCLPQLRHGRLRHLLHYQA